MPIRVVLYMIMIMIHPRAVYEFDPFGRRKRISGPSCSLDPKDGRSHLLRSSDVPHPYHDFGDAFQDLLSPKFENSFEDTGGDAIRCEADRVGPPSNSRQG